VNDASISKNAVTIMEIGFINFAVH